MSSLSTLSMNCPSAVARCSPDRQMVLSRSEEHTSELQSHSDLVCRLLLEKKKKRKQEIVEWQYFQLRGIITLSSWDQCHHVRLHRPASMTSPSRKSQGTDTSRSTTDRESR